MSESVWVTDTEPTGVGLPLLGYINNGVKVGNFATGTPSFWFNENSRSSISRQVYLRWLDYFELTAIRPFNKDDLPQLREGNHNFATPMLSGVQFISDAVTDRMSFQPDMVRRITKEGKKSNVLRVCTGDTIISEVDSNYKMQYGLDKPCQKNTKDGCNCKLEATLRFSISEFLTEHNLPYGYFMYSTSSWRSYRNITNALLYATHTYCKPYNLPLSDVQFMLWKEPETISTPNGDSATDYVVKLAMDSKWVASVKAQGRSATPRVISVQSIEEDKFSDEAAIDPESFDTPSSDETAIDPESFDTPSSDEPPARDLNDLNSFFGQEDPFGAGIAGSVEPPKSNEDQPQSEPNIPVMPNAAQPVRPNSKLTKSEAKTAKGVFELQTGLDVNEVIASYYDDLTLIGDPIEYDDWDSLLAYALSPEMLWFELALIAEGEPIEVNTFTRAGSIRYFKFGLARLRLYDSETKFLAQGYPEEWVNYYKNILGKDATFSEAFDLKRGDSLPLVVYESKQVSEDRATGDRRRDTYFIVTSISPYTSITKG